MRKDLLILFAILIPGAFISLAIAGNYSGTKTPSSFEHPTPFPTIFQSSDNSADNITLAPAKSKNIEVLSPRGGDFIQSGFIVKGNARVFENVVSARLTDSAGNILTQTTAYANAPDVGEFGPFDAELNFQTSDQEGVLEVYQVSAKDGSEVDKVTVPVLFTK